MRTRLFSKFVTIVAFTAFMGSSFAQNQMNEQILRTQLNAIKSYADGNTAAIQSPMEARHALEIAISGLSQEIFSVGSDENGSPSPVRRDTIEEIAASIAPYNQALVKLGFMGSSNGGWEDLGTECRALLKYTKPDSDFVKVLEAQTSDLTPQAGYAYDLLFEHRALSQEDRTQLGKKLATAADLNSREWWVMEGSKMRLPEIVPILCQMLRTPYDPDGTVGDTGVFGENQILSNYRKVLQAIGYLGPLASSALPLLRERLKELQAMLPKDKKGAYLAEFTNAINQIEGRKALTIASAVNGSGPLVPIADSALSLTDDAPPRNAPPLSGETPARLSREEARPVTADSTKENWFYVGFVVVGLGIAMILYVFFKGSGTDSSGEH
jgi:hypothetical protein